MKKMYIFTLAIMATTCSIGQDSNDSLTFESVNLASESFYNGADGAGQIPFNTITLSNNYDNTWDSWYGFSISNVTDNTTAGFNNQYASFPSGGSNSENYAIFYSFGEISFNQPLFIKSLDVANSTFAAISMRDGDFYSKQFGSTTNADGEIDGTNGEDYFILHIIPKDANDDLVGDTIHFYLADYRFADPNDDYILDTWTTIDLESQLIVANKIEFAFTSSDSGPFGSNTPTYFALDNLVVDPLVGIEEKTTNFKVYPNPCNDFINIKSDKEGSLEIKNQLGQTVLKQSISTNQNIDLSDFSNGMFFIHVTTNQGSSTTKIIKN